MQPKWTAPTGVSWLERVVKTTRAKPFPHLRFESRWSALHSRLADIRGISTLAIADPQATSLIKSIDESAFKRLGRLAQKGDIHAATAIRNLLAISKLEDLSNALREHAESLPTFKRSSGLHPSDFNKALLETNEAGLKEIVITGISRLQEQFPHPKLSESLRKWLKGAKRLSLAQIASDLQNFKNAWFEETLMDVPKVKRHYFGKLIALPTKYYPRTTSYGRLVGVDRWLLKEIQEGRVKADSFCDVACGAEVGAPTTFDTHFTFSNAPQTRNMKIDATDVVLDPKDRAHFRSVQEQVLHQGIRLYESDYLHRPLPRKYDVIRIANLSKHLTEKALRNLVWNMFHSLNPNGLLVMAWSGEDVGGQLAVYKKSEAEPQEYRLEPYFIRNRFKLHA